jgi:CRP/FNR family transcriptional regulator, anaerobic regulatory protein
MNHHLLGHIQKFISVSTALENRLNKISTPKTIEKGKFLHRPNQICQETYFISNGLLRVFYKKGAKEVTDNFAAEGEWITSIYSFMRNVPDNCFIETLEKSDLVSIKIDDLENCFTDFPEMERFGRILISNYFMEQSERIISMQFHTAQERYQFFEKTSRHKLPRVPLGMLASHLGMTQETLSRIRATKGTF